MNVYVRDKSFVDKKKNETVNYKEVYIKLDVQVEEDFEEVEIVLKIEDRFGKQLLIENLGSADFAIESNTKDNKTYFNPSVKFNVGQNQYKLPVKLSASDILVIRIANSQLGF